MQFLLVGLIGLGVGLVLGVTIGFRTGFLALRVAARVITAERREPTKTDIQLAA